MRIARVALFFCLFVLTTGSAIAVTDGEWSDAVDAAQAVDPTLTAPSPTDTDVSVVGGGKPNAGSPSSVAFGASRRNGEVRGRMVEVTTDTRVADVVCIGAIVAPGGEGGLARLVGRITQPASEAGQTMTFDVSDSSGPGGEGDLLTVSHNPSPPEETECTPMMPITPIAQGNFAVRSLD
jgi:hypothetical protein